MKKIKDLVHNMKQEIKHADEYYIDALLSDEERTKRVYANLAKESLNNVNQLHELAVAIIKEYAGTPPEAMLAIWNYEHEELMKDVDYLKAEINKL